MNPLLLMIGGLILALGLLALVSGVWSPRSGRRALGQSSLDVEAMARIEDQDIDQMLDALDDLRRRNGRHEVADELAHQLDGHLRDG